MALKSLNQLAAFRYRLIRWRNAWLQFRLGVIFGEDCRVSLSSRFRPHRRGDIVIGSATLIAFRTLFITRDSLSGESRPIRVGSHCFIGGDSTVMPGVTIGDDCIVGAGSVVFDDVPSRSIVVGNPARVLRRDVEVGRYGRLKGASETAKRLYQL
jgi:acetyltransferase-like isoleucine patch superfamily enzyme